jgi:CDP-glucose 4,6-dehydratase
MRVSITGITGLLGSDLANMLATSGHQVYGLVREDPSNIKLHASINKIYGNVNSFDDVSFFIKKSNPDYVFHLAAQTQALSSVENPLDRFYTNLVGTLNVLESTRLYSSPKAIIVASTDKAYGELDGEEYSEDMPLNGWHPYDASKVGTEIISLSYKKTYDLPVAATRACNIYGPGENNIERLIPGLINSHNTGKEFVVRNGGMDVREYIYVSDASNAYVKIAEYVSNGGNNFSFNISSGHRHSTSEIVSLVEQKLAKEINKKISNDNNLEIKHQAMNSELLRSLTGWDAEVGFSTGLDRTIDWMLQQPS